jgi:uncharacterized protein (DUF1330 family)
MKAYLIAVETVHDEAVFAEYRKQVVGTLVPFEGQFIARGGKLTMLEGQWQHPRTVIIEFTTREAAEAWYKSPDYQKIIGLRLKSTSGSLVILDGMDGEELAAELERIRADLAEHASERPNLQRCRSVMDLHMRAAWLLIALGRYDEAITSAGEANRARRTSIAFAPESPSVGAVLWQACEARAVAHLARGGSGLRPRKPLVKRCRTLRSKMGTTACWSWRCRPRDACSRTGFARSRRTPPENLPSSMPNATC